MKVARRVRKSALALDAGKANWFDLIDVNSLNMRNEHACVLGQTFSAEGRVMGVSGFDYARCWGGSRVMGVRFFAVIPLFQSSRRLREMWVHEIMARRNLAYGEHLKDKYQRAMDEMHREMVNV